MLSNNTNTTQDITNRIENLAAAFSIDIKNASPILIIMAKHHDGKALYHIGKIYYDKHSREGYLKAFDWFQLSCLQQNGDAYCTVGQMYQYGKGVIVNHAKAIEFYQYAAVVLDNFVAKYQLGNMCHYGIGCPPSYSEAFQWYSKAAHHNSGDAQCSLGYLYEKGQGVPQNNEFAMYWYQMAALNGSQTADDKVEALKKENVKAKSPSKMKSLDFNQTELLKSIKALMLGDSSTQVFTKKLESIVMERKFKMI